MKHDDQEHHMETDAYMAVVVSPDGKVWESTAAVASGHEAEYRVRRAAEAAFVHQVCGHLFKRGTDRLVWSVWDVARGNGWQCVVTPVTIQHATS